MGTNDDLPIDGLPLDEIERIKQQYGLQEEQAKMVGYILKNLPIGSIASKLTEDLWLREVLRDIHTSKGFPRTRALAMLGQYLGLLQKKAVGQRKRVVFDDK